jgi:hypothetical protein
VLQWARLMEKFKNPKNRFQESRAKRIREVKSYSEFIAIEERWKDALEKEKKDCWSASQKKSFSKFSAE